MRFSPLESTGLPVSRLALAATLSAAHERDLANLHKVHVALADSLAGPALDVGIGLSDIAGSYAGGLAERARAGHA